MPRVLTLLHSTLLFGRLAIASLGFGNVYVPLVTSDPTSSEYFTPRTYAFQHFCTTWSIRFAFLTTRA